jgi:hypothetical protein
MAESFASLIPILKSENLIGNDRRNVMSHDVKERQKNGAAYGQPSLSDPAQKRPTQSLKTAGPFVPSQSHEYLVITGR